MIDFKENKLVEKVEPLDISPSGISVKRSKKPPFKKKPKTSTLQLPALSLSKKVVKELLSYFSTIFENYSIKSSKITSKSYVVVFLIPDYARPAEAKRIMNIFDNVFKKQGFNYSIEPVISSGHIIGSNIILENKNKIKVFFKPIDRINRGFISEALLCFAIQHRLSIEENISNNSLKNFVEKHKGKTTKNFKNSVKISNGSVIKISINIPKQSLEVLFSDKLGPALGGTFNAVVKFVNENYSVLAKNVQQIQQNVFIENVGATGKKSDVKITSSNEETNALIDNKSSLSIKSSSIQIGQKRVGVRYENVHDFFKKTFGFSVNFSEKAWREASSALPGNSELIRDLMKKAFETLVEKLNKLFQKEKFVKEFLLNIRNHAYDEDGMSYVSFSPRTGTYFLLDFDKLPELDLELFAKMRPRGKWPIMDIFYKMSNGKNGHLCAIRLRLDKFKGGGLRLYLEAGNNLKQLILIS